MSGAKRILWIAVFAASLAQAVGEELRIARFDAVRVFDQYQRTKDAERKQSERRNSSIRGPASEGWDALQEMNRYNAIVARVKELGAKIEAAKPGSPERAELQIQERAAVLDARETQFKIQEASATRERKQQDEAKQLRAEILKDIRDAVKQLANDRGFQLVVPENLPEDIAMVGIFAALKGDDITEALLTLLNERYAAQKPK